MIQLIRHSIRHLIRLTPKASKNDSSVMDDPTGSFGSVFIRWVVRVQTITLNEGCLFYGLSVIGTRKQRLVRVMHMCRLHSSFAGPVLCFMQAMEPPTYHVASNPASSST